MSDVRLKAKEQPGNATVSYTSKYQFNDRRTRKELIVLSEEDWSFWKNNGYVIIENAVRIRILIW